MKNADKAPSSRKPWVLPRHRAVRVLFGPFVWLLCYLKYRIRPERFRDPGGGPYLILYNHQTPLDQFFVGLSFREPVYYLATEDIFSLGWVSRLIRWLVAPIPIKKQTTDISALRTMLQVAKEGGTIAIAPEGNRTYSGKTEHMLPTIAHFAKKLGMPIVLYRIEGGYGVEPRWSSTVRRGPMRAYVSRVISKEEAVAMSNEALFREIEQGLSVNEASAAYRYRSRKKAEYLERAVYVCPFCGLSVFRSRGDEVECLTCHRKIRYGEDRTLQGEGFAFPFSFFNDWYEYQNAFVRGLDLTGLAEKELFADTVRISEVIPYQRKNILYKDVPMLLYGNRIEIAFPGTDPWILPFETLSSMAVLGRNKLNLYDNSRIYQVKGDKRFNALKYVNLFYRYQNIRKGEENGEFLGL